jgi:hypothetical protein
MELIKTLGRVNKDNYIYYAEYKCPVCSEVVIRRTSNGKKSKTCGCLGRGYNSGGKFKHGDGSITRGARLYRIWHNMKGRCYLKSSNSYRWYGAKNIRVCDEWLDYVGFKKWAVVNGYSHDLCISRIDHDKSYRPENCTWQTMSENTTESNNRRWAKVKEKKDKGE